MLTMWFFSFFLTLNQDRSQLHHEIYVLESYCTQHGLLAKTDDEKKRCGEREFAYGGRKGLSYSLRQAKTSLWNLHWSSRIPRAREQLLRQLNHWSKDIVGQLSRTFHRRTHHYFSWSLPCSYSLAASLLAKHSDPSHS